MTGNYFPLAWVILNKLWEILALTIFYVIAIGLVIYLICLTVCIIQKVIEEYFS
jgi:hypothetical protein